MVKKPTSSSIAKNKKALFDYEILQEYEAGIRLEGREVKSLRNQAPNMKGAYISVQDESAWIKNMHIPKYKADGSLTCDPKRDRKLLLHKKQIQEIIEKMTEKGVTAIPVELYFKGNLIKVRLATVRGKKKHDKRETLKKRSQERQMRNIIKNYGR